MLSNHKLLTKKTGFTLIEMMFVILILSFVIVQIARTQQARVQQRTIEHAATDMLNWEIAIVNYYQANGKWPTNTTTAHALTSTTPPISPNYMPPSAVCSPFVTDTSSSGAPCYGRQPYSGSIPPGISDPNNSVFYLLSVEVNSYNMAHLLAAKLPNAYISSSSNDIIVYMAIPAPSQSQQMEYRGWIVSAGVVSTTTGTGNWPKSNNSSSPNLGPPGSSVFLPNCPPGFEGHIILSPLEYETNDYNWGIHMTMVTNSAATAETAGNTFVQEDGNGNHYIRTADIPDMKTDNDPNTGTSLDDTSLSIRHLATFMTICIRHESDPTKANNWATSLMDPNYPQDGECNGSPSWSAYLGSNASNCVYLPTSISVVGNANAY